jgi:hypothetical protein
MRGDFIVSSKKAELRQNKSSNFRFSNCTFIIWSGIPISCYRKTTYKEEDDELIATGYGYDFGDWKSYPTPELQNASDAHKEIAKLFNSGKNQIIAARTCYDMNRTPKLLKQIKLLILTADSSPDADRWQSKTINVLVCVSDAERGGFFVINNTRPCAERVSVSPFIFYELYCILTADYGRVCNEAIDIGCCGTCR